MDFIDKQLFLNNIKKPIQTKDDDNGFQWLITELENVTRSISQNNGTYYSRKVEEKNIERLKQIVWWLEDEYKNPKR